MSVFSDLVTMESRRVVAEIVLLSDLDGSPPVEPVFADDQPAHLINGDLIRREKGSPEYRVTEARTYSTFEIRMIVASLEPKP